MKEKLHTYLKSIGLDPTTVPQDSIKLFGIKELKILAERSSVCREWIKNECNQEVVAYALDTEYDHAIGVILRNLYSDIRRDRIQIANNKNNLPLWYNFHYAIPQIYKLGVFTLVEGPKDAQVLSSAGIPAVAGLGPAPTSENLRIIYRYARVVVWVGDRDVVTPQSEARLERVKWRAKEIGLKFIDYPISAHDPADLARDPAALQSLKSRVKELSSFIGY